MVVIRPKSMATKVSPSACQRSGCWVWRRFGGGWARVIVGVGWCCIEGFGGWMVWCVLWNCRSREMGRVEEVFIDKLIFLKCCITVGGQVART